MSKTFRVLMEEVGTYFFREEELGLAVQGFSYERKPLASLSSSGLLWHSKRCDL